jgi:CDP-6-deoxy-D-xylo-4-hexulose-3-dehydrase
MAELMQLAREHQWIVLEDTCESLGSRADGKYLGSFGDFGSYSFYYSHHITTGEGGMVVCETLEDYDLLRCLRAHGWSRPLTDRAEVEARHHDIDPRFLFVNVGFNFRPMEVQAAIGLCQLKRLNTMNQTRLENRDRLIAAVLAHPAWSGQLIFPKPAPATEPIWFGFPALLRDDLQAHYRAYLTYMSEHGVENRPIISGNFTRQPGLALMGVNCDPLAYPGAERIHNLGFFIGVHTEPLAETLISELAEILMGFPFA